MILEQVVLDVVPGQEEAFDAAFADAKGIIASSPGFLGLRLHRCIEQAHRFLLLVEWETLDDHMEGFRNSDAYGEWRAALHHFYDPFPTVQHYRLVHEA